MAFKALVYLFREIIHNNNCIEFGYDKYFCGKLDKRIVLLYKNICSRLDIRPFVSNHLLMRYKTHQFVFHRIYEMASLVEACVSNSASFIEINWENPNVIKCVSKFSKTSVLHYYIFAMISVEERRDLRKNHDIYEDSEEARENIEADLQAYGIDYLTYSDFLSTNVGDVAEDFPFRQWFLSQEDKFELLWEKLTAEVFQLLFANRSFLLQFNLSLADYLKSGNVKIPSEYLDKKGAIKRQHYFPTWVKKAIYYRDQGRCVLCQCDLTGLLSTDQRIHYDHIVPLNLMGTNDPCNLQLLCEDCNLSKSGILSKTATRYYPWWDY